MECATCLAAAPTADILTAQFGWRGRDDDIEQMEFDFYFTRNLKTLRTCLTYKPPTSILSHHSI